MTVRTAALVAASFLSLSCSVITDTDEFTFSSSTSSQQDSDTRTVTDSETRQVATDTESADTDSIDSETKQVATDTDSADTDSIDTEIAGKADCDVYCESVLSVCRAENAQYTTISQCLQICQYFTPGSDTDVSGNTLGCRDHFALEAIESPDALCLAAGPGGNGRCGSNCESFCLLQREICTGSNEQFHDIDSCMEMCARLDDTVVYSSAELDGNSLACRTAHLALAANLPEIHCPHIALDSSVCF